MSDEHPSAADLERIAQWPHTDLGACLDFVQSLWSEYGSVRTWLTAHEGYVVQDERDGKYLRLATGGWSGNEAILTAMRHNEALKMGCWQLTARGGLTIWKYPKD